MCSIPDMSVLLYGISNAFRPYPPFDLRFCACKPLLQCGSSYYYLVKPKPVEEPVVVVTQTAPTPTPVTTTPAPAPQQAATEKTRVITKIITKTVNNTAELNKLNARIEELESELAQERNITKALQARLAEREASVQQIAAAKQQLQEAYEASEKHVSQLREELDAVLDAQHEERWNTRCLV